MALQQRQKADREWGLVSNQNAGPWGESPKAVITSGPMIMVSKITLKVMVKLPLKKGEVA